jgi:hypothetical protein
MVLLVGNLADDERISGLNDGILSCGRSPASKVVGGVIVCIEIDPACRTVRHPGDRFPYVFRWRNYFAERGERSPCRLQNHGVPVYKSLTRNG